MFCNDIPLESKEVPIRKKQEREKARGGKDCVGKRMASCHTWTCKKMKNAIFFGPILLHIWCCYKTYTIKGLLLCPWCVVTGKPASPETQLYYYTTRTTTGHHATNHFFREKSRKNLDKLRFYWANMRKKHACYGSLEWNEQFGERGSNHSFLVPAFYQRLLFGAFIR